MMMFHFHSIVWTFLTEHSTLEYPLDTNRLQPTLHQNLQYDVLGCHRINERYRRECFVDLPSKLTYNSIADHFVVRLH